jgi:hypothetical protein
MGGNMDRNIEKVISYCGLICQGCPIYCATREQNKQKKEKMRAAIARMCKEHYGQECKPEDINDCDGCKATTGRLFCTNCEIRKCAIEKALENCAHCSEYACDRLKEFFVKDQEAKTRLDFIRSSL